MKIRPVGKRLLVKPAEVPTTSPSGLIAIPDTAKVIPISGKVISLGPDVTSEILEGDEVIYGKYAGTAVEMDGEKFLLLNEDDVIGVEEQG